MRLQARAPQKEAQGTKAAPSPSPSPDPQAGDGSGATISKDENGDDWATLSPNSSSPDSISNLLSPLPLPQKARIDNGTTTGNAAIPRPSAIMVPPPPKPHTTAHPPSQLTGAFLGSFFVLLLGIGIIYTWRLRTRRKRRDEKDHEAWLKVQMRTSGSEAGFKPPPSVMSSFSPSIRSKSMSAYSKSLYSSSDVSTNLGSDLSSVRSISNLYTVAPASWSDLSARSRYEQRRTAMNRVTFEPPPMPGPPGILVMSDVAAVQVLRSAEIRDVMSMASMRDHHQGSGQQMHAFTPHQTRRTSFSSRPSTLESSASASPSTSKPPPSTSFLDPPSLSASKAATCRPSTQSSKSRWSLSESFDDIDEASMWLPAKVSHPPGEEKNDEKGKEEAEKGEATVGGASSGHTSGSTTVEGGSEEGHVSQRSADDEVSRLKKELEELEASCGRITVEALKGSSHQARMHPPRPSRIQRPPTALSIVSETAETASIAGVSLRPPSMVSQASTR